MFVRILEIYKIGSGSMSSKKEEILHATLELFSQKGDHLSVADIAKKVAIKPPSIYSHFQSKNEIIEQILSNEIEQYYLTIFRHIHQLETSSQLTCKEKLEQIFWHVLECASNHERLCVWKNIGLIENHSLNQRCKNAIWENEKKLYQYLEELFQKAVEQHEIKACVHQGHTILFIAMLQGLRNELYLYQHFLDQEDCAEKTWSAYWDGIKADAYR
jgi:AcrR family transcriptional regulator